MREASDIGLDTIAIVVALALSEDEQDALAGTGEPWRSRRVRAAAARIAREPWTARALDHHLAPPLRGGIAACAAAARRHLAEGDLPGAASILWTAARAPGPAWRRFEDRLRRELVVVGLLSGCRAATAQAAK